MSNRPVSLRLLLVVALLPACSSGSGGGSGGGFQLTNVSVDDNETVKVNQPITFTFSEPVDFSTISLNTISIQTTSGAPATGTFFMPAGSPNRVVFQPSCPTLPDRSDTGLQPGNQPYVIRVLGSSTAANTVRSVNGDPLGVTQVVDFTTPPDDPSQFLDTRPTPPVPVVRAQGSTNPNATHVVIGSTGQRVYFERDAQNDIVLSEPGFEAPLNLYADPESQITFEIEFDQALSPDADNVTEERMRLEFNAGTTGSPDWQPIDTLVTLVANCTEAGARVRLEPVGILPPGREVRAVVFAGVRDLLDDPGPANDDFAVLTTRTVDFASLVPPDAQSDEFPETFAFGGSSSASNQDTALVTESTLADWGDGSLTSAFDFFDDPCTGGPTITFDWVVPSGARVVLDTDGDVILGPGGTTSLVVEGSGPRAGLVELRNLLIEAGATVRVQGSNPLRINATGAVGIFGVLDASGFDAADVQLANTGNVIERGAAGGPGGGAGGNANGVVTASTPRGGFGQGPLDEFNAGGQGGESSFGPSQPFDARRPGGGGGGRFADAAGASDAEAGFDGSTLALGAVTNTSPPKGGAKGVGPFVDGRSDNDFFGVRALGTPGNVTSLVRGELPSLWGGYGGGGGGNATTGNSFPTANWTPSSDEKGGGGGGGGGVVHIRALGSILFGPAGLIKADGGRGARGESIPGFQRIGGTGGSGSGGHIVLETAAAIVTPRLSALGGPRVLAPDTLSAGGRGGVGVVQLHVPDPVSTPPAGVTSTPPAIALVPSFGSRSTARSKWIPVGGAELKPDGTLSLIRFLFQGVDTVPGPDQGRILDQLGPDGQPPADGLVDELAPILDLDLASTAVVVDRLTLRIDQAPLLFTGSIGGISNDLYLRNASLLEGFLLRLVVGAEGGEFDVADATYDDATGRLTLRVADTGTGLTDFLAANPGAATYQLVPRFFLVSTCGEPDRLPTGSAIRIRFQAATDDGTGAPDEANPLVDWTGDISDFNAQTPGDVDFVRFEVEFDLGVVGPGTQPVSLEFLRIPFVF